MPDVCSDDQDEWYPKDGGHRDLSHVKAGGCCDIHAIVRVVYPMKAPEKGDHMVEAVPPVGPDVE